MANRESGVSKENEVQHSIRSECGSKPGVVLYRNNVGNAEYEVNGRKWRVPYGLCEGASDLIGWRTVTVTPDMVGQKIAQFVAIEVKAPGAKTKKARLEKQKLFVACVQNSGGRAGFARSLEEAEEILGS